jgi:sodium/proline symporter
MATQPFIGTVMILVGVGTALYWRYGLDLSGSIYEVMPGMLAGFAVYGAARLCVPASSLAPAAPIVVTTAGEQT